MKRKRPSERGVALLAAMIGIALMTIIVMDFATSAAMGHLTAANVANELRAYYLARSGVNVGVAVLARDARDDSKVEDPIDSLGEVWAMPVPPIAVEGGTVAMSIVDDARKLSVNRIINPADGSMDVEFVQTLERLFHIIDVPPEVLAAIIDWVDPNDVPSPGGAESSYYLGLVPPYAARNGPMPTIGDLRMVRGVDEATFFKLRQFLTAAPELRVNANTAPPEVLASLLPELAANQGAVKEILRARQLRPFAKVTDVANLPALAGVGTQLTALLTTRSDYFTITAMGSFGGTRKMVYATFRRQDGGGAALASWQEN
jgi:general secretion pathway protein K